MSVRTPWDPKFDGAGRADGSPGYGTPGPVLHDPRSTGLTYEAFYGLREKPFSLSSDSRFFYHSRLHAPAYDDLLAVIRRRESLSVLTGDIGTGKTTLCRAVLQNLDRKTFSAFVPDPFASREDLLKVVLMDFGVLSVDDLTSGRLKDASRTELSYLLYEFLGTLGPLQAFAVVIIDEAQNLSVPLLEEIRILSDSDGRERQLQVVLVGQLELREKLKLPEMRQVDQRVSVHCCLAPLGRDDVAGYVAHRLQSAGGSPDRVRFSQEAIDVVYRESGGVPRLINRICDRALTLGYVKRAATIDREILEASLPAAPVEALVEAAPAIAVAPSPVAPPPSDVAPPSSNFAPPPSDVAPAALDVAQPPAEVLPPLSTFEPPLSPGFPLPRDPDDPVNEWLTVMDQEERAGIASSPPLADLSVPVADVARPERLIPLPTARRERRIPLPMARPERLIPLPTAEADAQEHKARVAARLLVRSRVRQTRRQKVIRKWTRRLGIAALWILGLTAAGAGGSSLWMLSTAMWEQTAPLLLPALPPEPPRQLAPALKLPAPPETETALETSRR